MRTIRTRNVFQLALLLFRTSTFQIAHFIGIATLVLVLVEEAEKYNI